MIKIALNLACLGAFVLAGPLAEAQAPPTLAETQEANLKAYISMMRQDLKKDKVAILTELMALGPDQASRFWPVYNEYDKALTKLGDERIVFIRMYADNFEGLTDQLVTKLATGMLDLETRRVDLRRQYFQRLSQTLTPKDAVRWLQIETQIERVLDLQILSSLPIIE